MQNSLREERFSIETIANILIIFLISAGVIFSLVTALGLIRLPDVYTRIHAASKSSTLGVMSILLGVYIHFWLIDEVVAPQLIIALVFLFMTSPVAGHMIGRASYMTGIKVTQETVQDDLEKAIKKKKAKK